MTSSVGAPQTTLERRRIFAWAVFLKMVGSGVELSFAGEGSALAAGADHRIGTVIRRFGAQGTEKDYILIHHERWAISRLESASSEGRACHLGGKSDPWNFRLAKEED